MLRVVCGVFLIVDGVTRISAESRIPSLTLLSIEVVGAVLLVVGLWTPIAGILVVIVELCLAFSGMSSIENSVLLAAIGAALATMGPGAHSVDAKRYGRKRIDIGKDS